MNDQRNTCPDNESILRIFLADQGERDNDALINHIANCSRCRIKINLLKAVQKSSELSDFDVENFEPSVKEKKAFRKMARLRLRELTGEAKPRKRPSFGFSGWTRWAAAAGALIILLGGYFALRQTARDDQVRNSPPTDFRLISPLGHLKEAPDSFSWTPVKESDLYLIKVIDADLQIIFEVDTKTTLLTLDPAIQTLFKKGITYLWTVEVWPDSGQMLDRAQGTFIIE